LRASVDHDALERFSRQAERDLMLACVGQVE